MDVETLLTPTALGDDRFSGPPADLGDWRTFGGLLAAQAMMAAAATVGDRPCHSLHLLFAGAGKEGEGVDIAVDRVRDGARFAQRRIEVGQGDRRLVTALASFHAGDDGPEHQVAMPAVADPETLEDQRGIRLRNAAARGVEARRYVAEELLDARPTGQMVDRTRGVEGRRQLWFRARRALSGKPILHQALIAFASDMGLVSTGMLAHNELGGGAPLDAASLDHAIWFHKPARADDWLLHAERAPVAAGGRGLSLGEIFDRSGRLIASVAQETLLRRKR